jgi:hypothetical protein
MVGQEVTVPVVALVSQAKLVVMLMDTQEEHQTMKLLLVLIGMILKAAAVVVVPLQKVMVVHVTVHYLGL